MIVTLSIEVEVEDHDVLTTVVQELFDAGRAPVGALEDTAEAVGEVLNADIPLRDAGLSLVHWEAMSLPDDCEES